MGSRRAAWRTISAIQNKEEYKGSKHLELIKWYRKTIENELHDLCQSCLTLLTDTLIRKADVPEAIVFYMKMKGDYYRYLAEVATGQDRKDIMNQSQEAYKGAFDVAQKEMPVSTLCLLFTLLLFRLANSSNSTWFGIELHEDPVLKIGETDYIFFERLSP